MDADTHATVELHYSEALLRKVVHRWWIRAVGPWLGIGLAAFGTPLVFGLAHGDRSWIVGALGTVVLLLMFFARQIRSAHLQNTLKRLQLLQDGKVSLRVSHNGLAFESSAGSMLTRWQDLEEVRVERDYWLLLRAPNDFSTLPLAIVGPTLQDYLLGRFRAAGARIRVS